MTSRSATLIGFGAILLWSTLALFTAMSGRVPPFQLVAMTFALGGALILGVAAVRGRLAYAQPHLGAVILGILGLFGDTALYYSALKLAPPADANLIHYLWPLLIVLFAAFLPGGRLSLRHVLGALIGMAATALIVMGRKSGADVAGPDIYLGYALAFAGAFVWSGYSVLSRRLASVPTESIGMTTLICTIPAVLCHLSFETTNWPGNLAEWTGVVGLGLGSTGLALICWDIGMKRGDVAFLGVASYAAPVLSTLILVATGYASASWLIALSCVLIVVGALVAGSGKRAGPSSTQVS